MKKGGVVPAEATEVLGRALAVELVNETVGPVDGNKYPMDRAQPYLRRRPVAAMRMLAPFKVVTMSSTQDFSAGDWLCEQDGVRWGVSDGNFSGLFEPVMTDGKRSPWAKRR